MQKMICTCDAGGVREMEGRALTNSGSKEPTVVCRVFVAPTSGSLRVDVHGNVADSNNIVFKEKDYVK